MAGKKHEPSDVELYVASRSDVKDIVDGKFRKQFSIQGLRIDGDRPSDENSKAQQDYANQDTGCKQGALQEALNRGLHPKGKAELEGVEFVESGLNWSTWRYTYAVPVIPAHLDLDPETTELPVRREADKRESVRQSRLRAAADPAGFAE